MIPGSLRVASSDAAVDGVPRHRAAHGGLLHGLQPTARVLAG